jgi:hypothetical protein
VSSTSIHLLLIIITYIALLRTVDKILAFFHHKACNLNIHQFSIIFIEWCVHEHGGCSTAQRRHDQDGQDLQGE